MPATGSGPPVAARPRALRPVGLALMWLAGSAALYAAAAALGVALSLPGSSVATFWPAAGVGLCLVAAALGCGWLMTAAAVVGIFAGVVVANIAGGSSLVVALAFAAANLAESLIAATVLLAVAPRVKNPMSVYAALLPATVAGVAVSSFIAAVAVAPVLGAEPVQFAGVFAAADILGILLIAPAGLVWLAPFRAASAGTGRYGEAALQTLILAASLLFAFRLGQPDWMLWGLVPILMWGALRVGPRLATAQLAALSVLIVLGAGRVPWEFPLQVSTESRLIFVQAALAAMAVTIPILGLVVAQLRHSQARAQSARALAQSARQDFQRLAENSRSLLVLEDAHANVEWISPSVSAVLGWSRGDLLGRRLAELCHPADRAAYESMRGKGGNISAARTVGTAGAFRMLCHDGRYRWMDGRARAEVHDRSQRWVVDLQDVHDLLGVQRRLAESEQRFRMATMDSAVAYAMVDLGGSVLETNRSFDALVGVAMDDGLAPILLADLVADEDRGAWSDALAELIEGGSQSVRARLRFATGTHVRWGDATISPLTVGSDRRVVVQIVDITAEQRTRTELLHQSRHDPLTGLANRYRMREVLAEALVAAREGRSLVAVLYLDVDNFKVVNDTLTHVGGDELLVQVAERLRNSLREGDLVARVGGDEFVCILQALKERTMVHRPVEEIMRSVCGDYLLRGSTMRVTVSLGAAVGSGETDPDDLLREADAALYAAKAAGRDCWRLHGGQPEIPAPRDSVADRAAR